MNRLEELNERYTAVNMTGFKVITENIDQETVLRHFRIDLEILRTSDVKMKDVYRVILRDDVIDICSNDNGTPISYYFAQDARFAPDDIRDEIEDICTEFDVRFEVFD